MLSKTIQRGRVVSYYGHSVAVELESGQVISCALRRNGDKAIVGDWVKCADGAVLEVELRRSSLLRANKTGPGTKAIVANIDTIVIVMVPPPIFSSLIIDRYIVCAKQLNLSVILVLNKVDLLPIDQSLPELEAYGALGYPCFYTSVLEPHSLKSLQLALNKQSAVLLGPSGVGKSSMISLLTGQAIRVGDVSAKGIGKHTTTASRLYALPEGGAIIDSPGVRDFGLWPISVEAIYKSFVELEDLIGMCQYRNCSHHTEPECAIQQAVATGKISSTRYNHLKTILAQYTLQSYE